MIKQKNAGQKNKRRLWKIFIFLPDIFLLGLAGFVRWTGLIARQPRGQS